MKQKLTAYRSHVNVNRYGITDWDKVCVFDPAVRFGISLIGAAEFGRYPTEDRFSDQLGGGNRCCQDDENGHCVDMVHLVHPVICCAADEFFEGHKTRDRSRMYQKIKV